MIGGARHLELKLNFADAVFRAGDLRLEVADTADQIGTFALEREQARSADDAAGGHLLVRADFLVDQRKLLARGGDLGAQAGDFLVLLVDPLTQNRFLALDAVAPGLHHVNFAKS